MKLMPLVYVTDMDRAVGFYSSLLPASSVVTSSPYWTELNVGGASLALHLAETVDHKGDGMALGFDAATTLEQVMSLLSEAGIEPSGEICAQPFGRSVTVTDPDGLVIQINEHSVPPAN
jgi:predicted enzyme related to lactoylglutathione lyase